MSLLETLEKWKALAQRVIHLLRDANTTEFEVVTIPEAMGVNLTMRLLSTFEDYGIPVGHLIVNNVIRSQDAAECSSLKKKRRSQLKWISYIRERLRSQLKIIEIPLLSSDLQGVESIHQFVRYLFPHRN